MSGPEGPDQQWQSPGKVDDEQSLSEQPAAASSWQQPDQSAWQAPAYTPSGYPQYQQPPAQFYPQYSQPGYPQYGQPDQYGQPGQYPQYGQPGQYGQYPQYGQPGQYPQPYAPYAESAVESKRSLAVIGAVVGVLAVIVIAIVLVLGFWSPGLFVTTKLDITKAQAGVQQILSDETNGYGARNVKDVKCNSGKNPTVHKGATFDCTVSIDGMQRHVTVTFQDNKGTYEVGRPQ
ncbi:MAG: DUF4333 domain-containing protein [Mycobacteriaceae bacterium]|nr:DUF4333 domain-containing protein [Mycobacteriaceae bacterium]